MARARVLIEGLMSSDTGGCHIEKEINKLLIQDNKSNNLML